MQNGRLIVKSIYLKLLLDIIDSQLILQFDKNIVDLFLFGIQAGW